MTVRKLIAWEDVGSLFANGMTIMFGGFMGVGTPDGLVSVMIDRGTNNLTLIGNAVPPVLGYHVAKSVAAYLEAVLPHSFDATVSHQKGLSHERIFAIQETLFA